MKRLFLYLKNTVEWLVWEDGQAISSGCLNLGQVELSESRPVTLANLLPKEYLDLPCIAIISGDKVRHHRFGFPGKKSLAHKAALFSVKDKLLDKPENSLHIFRSNADKHDLYSMNKALLHSYYQSLEGLQLQYMLADYHLIAKSQQSWTGLCLPGRLLLNPNQTFDQNTSNKAENERERESSNTQGAMIVHGSWLEHWWQEHGNAIATQGLELCGDTQALKCSDEMSRTLEQFHKGEACKNSCPAAELEQLLIYAKDQCNADDGQLLNAACPPSANTYRIAKPPATLIYGAALMSIALTAAYLAQ